MLTAALGRKAARAGEAASLMWRHACGLRSKAALLSCYAAIVGDPMDRSEVALTLGAAGRRFPIRMRKCDVFTLAEIFHERQYALRSPVPDAPVVFDCGANIGLSAVWFLSRFPGATVHCFEPAPDNAGLLADNVGRLRGVVVNRAAAGRLAGRTTLHLAPVGAMHSLVAAPGEGANVLVDVLNLAEYLQATGLPGVDVLKLDVEGSELDVLEGMGERLHDVRVIVGEVHEALVHEAHLYALLDRFGFRVVHRRPTSEAHVHLFEAARPDTLLQESRASSVL